LIFSHWNDVLALVERALTSNKIESVRIKDRSNFQRSLDRFKQDLSVPVLLLNLRSGGNGLNLIEAQHVLLVEPALNVSLEQQAVNRVYRIGQQRPTFVYRFFIRETVEEAVSELARRGRAGATPTKRDEELSNDDVAVLISLKPSAALSQNNDDTHDDNPLLSSSLNSAFWQSLVEFRGNITTRQAVFQRLSVTQSWTASSSSSSSSSNSNSTILFGRSVPVPMLAQLLHLKSFDSSAELQSTIHAIARKYNCEQIEQIDE
jgi:hypothetical protein